MKYCAISYAPIAPDAFYSPNAIKRIAPKLTKLNPIELTATDLLKRAHADIANMSIPGMQAKLCAKVNLKKQCFEIDPQGLFILKPQNEDYRELPENEAITMKLAETVGLDVPLNGLIFTQDNYLTYFIKRFDRLSHYKRHHIEDFAQLSLQNRDTKYASSMENVARLIATYCTFPKIEFVKLFKLTLFNFLVGNEDMHLKNFTLITVNNKVMLAPCYDLLNTSIVLNNTQEEMALPLHGKKQNLQKDDFFGYFAKGQLGLNNTIIDEVIHTFQKALATWHNLIQCSYLSIPMQKSYIALLKERCARLG
ncbi:MAG: phosphatidylinositol kinase [Legionellales bacterium RIFCSPHIGHO2_12_FULL_37_14]|nr:MAG: phosphatidylinositol kinase [Legionellales bacterium RIFCSPHIGHO2_12_FULL_37_14]